MALILVTGILSLLLLYQLFLPFWGMTDLTDWLLNFFRDFGRVLVSKVDLPDDPEPAGKRIL